MYIRVRVRSVDLLLKPAGSLVRFVLFEHPVRGKLVLTSTDLALEPIEIIRQYGLRVKIELGFKQEALIVESFKYHI